MSFPVVWYNQYPESCEGGADVCSLIHLVVQARLNGADAGNRPNTVAGAGRTRGAPQSARQSRSQAQAGGRPQACA